MRRSILLTVLALGAQAAWAQDATDPTGDEVVVEGSSETVEQTTDEGDGTEVTEEETEVVEEVGDGDEAVGDGTEVVDSETGVVGEGTEVTEEETEVVEELGDGDEAVGDGTEVIDGETGVEDDETEVSENGDAVPTDNRSARGAVRGGHHGQVSTLALAGLGPVFGKLRSQGYGDIAIEQVGNEITISAARPGETRQLVYDASTGALLSDVAGPSSDGILQGFSSKLKKQSPVSNKLERKGSDVAHAGGKDRDNGSNSGSGKSTGKGGGNGKSTGHGNGGGNGKSNGHGNGGSKGGGKNH